MRKNELDLTEIENFKLKKENNAKEILNQQMHSKITSKLLSTSEQISQIESKLKDMSLPSEDYDYEGSSQSLDYSKREALVRGFVEIEEQVTQFDKEINELLNREAQPIVNNIATIDHIAEPTDMT